MSERSERVSAGDRLTGGDKMDKLLNAFIHGGALFLTLVNNIAIFRSPIDTEKIYDKINNVASKTDGRCPETERPWERKVRAQGRMPDNVWRRRLQGQCNRNKPPAFAGKGGRAA